jgi:ornithine decarboxylase
MSRLETLPAINPIDFTLSASTDSCTHFHENNLPWATNALVNDILTSSPPLRVTAAPFNPNAHPNGEVIFPSLPPLLTGHPELHLRNGIMNASRLAAAHEPDAEKAFFVADLSVVYRQHQRWKACLPEIQPFYGPLEPLSFLFHFVRLTIDIFLHSCQVQSRSICHKTPCVIGRGVRLRFQQ